MSSNAVEVFIESVEERIDYFRKEYDMSYAELIGALEVLKLDIWTEMQEEAG